MSKNSIVALVAILILAIACNNPSSNTEQTTNEFADLADDREFREKHDEPIEIERTEKGETISFEVEGGENASAYQLKKVGSKKYLLVIHEWWGLNDHIKREADSWFEKLGNANVIALDLYDGKVATTREDASTYMKGAEEKRIVAIIDGLMETLPEGAEIGTIGWCFGGGWSLKTAIHTKARACVMYYGMPITDVDGLKELQTDVLFIYGKQDRWINEEVATAFESNMKKAAQIVTILPFDADHAFANPSSERYIEEAAQKANAAAFEYLKNKL